MHEPCPSNFVLDAFRLGLDSAPADHVKACRRCTDWLAAQARLQGQLAPLAIPAARQRPRAGFAKYLLGLCLPLAAGATALLVSLGPNPPTETAKGGAVPVEIARMRDGAIAWLRPD